MQNRPDNSSKCIVLTGPESTGKTTLCEQLATHFETLAVSEFARDYLENRASSDYELDDLKEIARGQIRQTEEISTQATQPFFSDTDLHVIRIWAIDKFGSCPAWITDYWLEHPPLIYLLCEPDTSWQQDPLREDEDQQKRYELFKRYESELKSNQLDFVRISGLGEERLHLAIEAVSKYFNAY